MTAVAGQAAGEAELRSTDPIPPPTTRTKRVRSGEGRFAAFLIGPTIVLLLVIIGYPLVRAIVDSFRSDATKLDPATGTFLPAGQFTGFDNWAHWLGQRCGDTSCPPGTLGAQFWSSTGVTFGFTVFEVIVDTAIGLAFALMMNKAFRGRALVRAVILVPWAIPTAVTAKLWYVIFQSEGILNRVLGIHTVWFASIWPSRAAIMISDIWKTTPFMALLILAGLQVIPADIYESAKVDGASAWQRFYKITLPLVKPALAVAVIFRAMDVMRMYDLPAIMTGGANGTTTLSYLVALQIRQGPFSASTLSTITFIFIFILALVLIKAFNANVFESPEKTAKKQQKEAAPA